MTSEAPAVLPSVAHSTFVIERHFSAPPGRVFAAWSNSEKKQRWFSCHDDWRPLDYQLDFRLDGIEINDVADSEGVLHRYRARYLDIVPNQRIVYAYEMHVGAARISVSLVTVTFSAEGQRTKQIFTEQVAFLDGHSNTAERQEGTELGLARIDALLLD